MTKQISLYEQYLKVARTIDDKKSWWPILNKSHYINWYTYDCSCYIHSTYVRWLLRARQGWHFPVSCSPSHTCVYMQNKIWTQSWESCLHEDVQEIISPNNFSNTRCLNRHSQVVHHNRPNSHVRIWQKLKQAALNVRCQIGFVLKNLHQAFRH